MAAGGHAGGQQRVHDLRLVRALKFKSSPLWVVILASWGIAFFEYLLMVPANRWGHANFSATQLKIIQEVVTLLVFSVFVIAWLGERIRWNHVAAFACILAAVAFTFLPGALAKERRLDPPPTGQQKAGNGFDANFANLR